MTTRYQELTLRNAGYISEQLQSEIADTRVLIAGCGIGSQVAEAAARVGFQNFVLVDGDTVDRHNINRQSFFSDQVGKFKVDALKENILRINPEARVTACQELATVENADRLVGEADLVFDTIDFLDLPGIVALHDEAHRQKRHLVSSFSVGFGAAVVSFPAIAGDHALIREIFDLPRLGSVADVSYVERYIKLFGTLAPALQPDVLRVMQQVFKDLADGKVCPAPQVAPGAYAVAAACITAALRLLSGEPITVAPTMVVLNLSTALQGAGFKLA